MLNQILSFIVIFIFAFSMGALCAKYENQIKQFIKKIKSLLKG